MKLERAKGTRDFSCQEQLLRNRIMDTIKTVFEQYGFLPLETPIIERFDVMTAKFAAGEEADSTKEIFKLTDQGNRKLGLRYEFTFPLARYVAMNPKLKLPLKRYQMGPVFRDGPIKKGRYREFYQCDIDCVGSTNLLADAEVVSAVAEVFRQLNVPIVVKTSSRKFLFELLSTFKIPKSKQQSAIISIDKLEKIGMKGVLAEMVEKGIKEDQGKQILETLNVSGTSKEKLNTLKTQLGDTPAIQELSEFFSWLDQLQVPYEFSPSLARGLGYYTGPIFEAFSKKGELSVSIAGGGRWDDMIGNYMGDKQTVPATGFSIGLEPLFELIKERETKGVLDAYIIPLQTQKECLNIATTCRKEGLCVTQDLMQRSLRKNLDYASSLSIPYTIIVGENEVKKNTVTLRNMQTSKQQECSLRDAIKIMKKAKATQ